MRRQRARPLQRPAPRIGIVGVEAGHDAEQGRAVVGGVGEYRYAIQRPARRHHACGGDEPEARLAPDDVVAQRRHAAGAGRIGAERRRHQAGCDRNGGTGARSARNELSVERIAWHPIGRAHADETGRELIEVGLADDDGAGLAQARHAGRVHGGAIREGRAGRRGRQAAHVDVVLDGDRNAVEGQIAVAVRRQLVRLRERVVFVEERDEDGRIVEGADAGIAARHDVGRRRGAGPVGVQNFGDGFDVTFGHAEGSGGGGRGLIVPVSYPLCSAKRNWTLIELPSCRHTVADSHPFHRRPVSANRLATLNSSLGGSDDNAAPADRGQLEDERPQGVGGRACQDRGRFAPACGGRSTSWCARPRP